MSVAHHLPHARFAVKPAHSLAAKAAEFREKALSLVEAPSGDALVSVAFGAVAIYGLAMVVSLLTL